MENAKKIIAIESSCDDSAVSIFDSDLGVLSNVIISQDEFHSKFSGIVPEIASRSHLENLQNAIVDSLKISEINWKLIDAVSVCSGPGLVGSLIVGITYAKSIASILKKPIIEINHLEGHILSPQIEKKISYPYLVLLISGGHSQFVLVKNFGNYQILGKTLDDALGECFDKVAKMLKLPFPGGPEIEKNAKLGDRFRFVLSKPLFNRDDCNMSFSGLKTNISILINQTSCVDQKFVKDLSASFQHTVTEILCKKTQNAIKIFENYVKKYNIELKEKNLVIAGGVACNSYIKNELSSFVKNYGYCLIVPSKVLCRDNAAMIAFAGMERLKLRKFSDIFFEPKPRWNLEEVNIS
ncbi:MAG: tRNA (adenosine(37)-N6)-threonylcarbamoyltransferase complex transferase subunit TsaD [Rickettsia sp.]|nr:tRNA (adenosine(37)-N6)-threonylcarbamoyltransferase complex transferase subunit TsaD [Rickettsia sp.]